MQGLQTGLLYLNVLAFALVFNLKILMIMYYLLSSEEVPCLRGQDQLIS